MKKAGFNILAMFLCLLFLHLERVDAGKHTAANINGNGKDDAAITHWPEKGKSMTFVPAANPSKSFYTSEGELIEMEDMQPFTEREWTWVRTVMNNDETFVPDLPDSFVIQFMQEGNFSGKTDCNSFFGQYEIQEHELSLGPIGATRVFCENSQEDVFLKFLNEVDSYFVNDEGFLFLQLKYDSGAMIFR